MLNMFRKHVVLSRDVIRKKNSKYVSTFHNTNADGYVLQVKFDTNRWSNVKNDPVKTKNVKTDQDYRGV